MSYVLDTLELIEGEYSDDFITHSDMEKEGFKFQKKIAPLIGATGVSSLYRHPNYPHFDFVKGVGTPGLVIRHGHKVKSIGIVGVVKNAGDVHSFLSNHYVGNKHVPRSQSS